MERSAWWQRLRSQFPLLSERAYLFPGSHGPLARDAKQAMEAVLEVWDRDPAGIHISEGRHVDACAEAVGALTGVPAGRVAFASNTSDALNIAAATVLNRWRQRGRPAGNVVLHSQSHAASTYAWLNAVRLGEPLEIRIAEREDGEDPIEAPAPASARPTGHWALEPTKFWVTLVVKLFRLTTSGVNEQTLGSGRTK